MPAADAVARMVGAFAVISTGFLIEGTWEPEAWQVQSTNFTRKRIPDVADRKFSDKEPSRKSARCWRRARASVQKTAKYGTEHGTAG